jgi:hypothetical protein
MMSALRPPPGAVQGSGSIAFSVYSDLLARRGLRVDDPSSLFADEAYVRRMLAGLGYSGAELETSQERNVRRGQAPAQWAAAMWRAVSTMPFAPLAGLGDVLSAEARAALQAEYLAAAERTAEGFATPEGIVEPYVQLWVFARK